MSGKNIQVLETHMYVYNMQVQILEDNMFLTVYLGVCSEDQWVATFSGD